ncbi:MAG: AAA family ATPase [Deltaproteobacteria bacterium]|nr:AAA family ATPase [Deltaproteobacteria bacterium]
MSVKPSFRTVPPEGLRAGIDPDSLGFETTDDCSYFPGIIGQARAVGALTMGLEIESPGYNIYVAGLTGTGKMSTIKSLLDQLDLKKKIPDDICYVNNFEDPDRPTVIMLPAGLGRQFQKDMDDMVIHLGKQIPRIFESEEFKRDSEKVVESHMARQKELVKNFNEKIQHEKFQLVQYQVGPYTRQDVAYVVEGKPHTLEQLEELNREGRFPDGDLEAVREKQGELRNELEMIMRESRQIEKEIRKEIGLLERRTGLPAVQEYISDILTKYTKHSDRIEPYLRNVQEHVLSNLKTFREKDEEQPPAPLPFFVQPPEKRLTEYGVNVLVDNSQTKEIPVIIETMPSYKNLFGTIEREIDRSGFWRTDFTRIKAGSLLRANGGYIVFNAYEALVVYGVWSFLKRTLTNRLLTMQPYDPFGMSATAIKPEPIPVDLKIIMVGGNFLYQQLYEFDDDFKKIFKVKAEFDTSMPIGEDAVGGYIQFMKKIIDDEDLLRFDKTAAAAIIEYGVRISGKRKRLSTRFSDVADIMREAGYWAKKEGSDTVRVKHVDRAYDEKVARVRLIEDKIQEMIEEGTILIDTDGAAVGQVNGLSVYDMGDYAFGKPARITAQTSMGRAGFINIEREAKLSGKTHDKGVLILEGYFKGKYAQKFPLSMDASICFEQSYAGVDGDSASLAEVCAILSSLSELPVNQNIAMTGSVNQRGEIQPVGGVNQKIEGFYDVCRSRGLTGGQGVIIPALNLQELMLRKDLVEAVSKGMFQVYPVSTVDEGMNILTGVEPGERDEQGRYPAGTVNFLVSEKLRSLAENLKNFGSESKESGSTKKRVQNKKSKG